MALNVSNVPSRSIAIQRINSPRAHKSLLAFGVIEYSKTYLTSPFTAKGRISTDVTWGISARPVGCSNPRMPSMICLSTRTNNTNDKERCNGYENGSDAQIEEGDHFAPIRSISSNKPLAEYVCNDAKFVNQRARNDIVLLSRGIMRLDARARQDVAILGSEFLKLDARAREDTEKIDRNVKRKAEHLHHIATILKNRAETKLKIVADKHWNDGALEADLRRADFRAKQRAMEDTIMALEFVRNVHDMMVQKMYKFSIYRGKSDCLTNNMIGHITLEKNGRTLGVFPGEVSSDRVTAIQEAYWSMASALSEADGIDYTDPEELELLITTLIDLDAMDSKSSASLLAECSSSPDASTRQALANALAAAPSMWTLGNAGMGALQRLAEDSNPAIAAAASNAIFQLKKQWEIEEGDSFRFMMSPNKPNEIDTGETNGETDAN